MQNVAWHRRPKLKIGHCDFREKSSIENGKHINMKSALVRKAILALFPKKKLCGLGCEDSYVHLDSSEIGCNNSWTQTRMMMAERRRLLADYRELACI